MIGKVLKIQKGINLNKIINNLQINYKRVALKINKKSKITNKTKLIGK